MDQDNNNHQEYEVESILGYKTVMNKELYRIKWLGYNLKYATWEPIENLANCVDKINEYEAHRGKEIEQIFGCGQQNNTRYFLVKFKGEEEKTFIDWDTAKNYSVDVMEYFGSRLVWQPRYELMNSDDDQTPSDADSEASSDHERNGNQNPIEELENAPNDIEYDQ